MPGFLVEEGGMEKLVIVAISLNLLTESLDRKHVTLLSLPRLQILYSGSPGGGLALGLQTGRGYSHVMCF